MAANECESQFHDELESLNSLGPKIRVIVNLQMIAFSAINRFWWQQMNAEIRSVAQRLIGVNVDALK